MKDLSQSYRDRLATELTALPKNERKELLGVARKSEEYIWAMVQHVGAAANGRYDKEVARSIEDEPNLEFDLDNLDDLKSKLIQVARYLYGTITAYNREGGYDPQKGHMLCGEITDKFIAYLKRKGVESGRVCRSYQIKSPDGTYDESYGHVYLTLDRENDYTLIDPTYLQFVEPEKRQGREPVLVIRYKDQEDFRSQLQKVPIENPMMVLFYLGFNSQQARDFFEGSNYTVISEDIIRLDD